jgi:hypothetical protein
MTEFASSAFERGSSTDFTPAIWVAAALFVAVDQKAAPFLKRVGSAMMFSFSTPSYWETIPATTA